MQLVQLQPLVKSAAGALHEQQLLGSISRAAASSVEGRVAGVRHPPGQYLTS